MRTCRVWARMKQGQGGVWCMDASRTLPVLSSKVKSEFKSFAQEYRFVTGPRIPRHDKDIRKQSCDNPLFPASDKVLVRLNYRGAMRRRAMALAHVLHAWCYRPCSLADSCHVKRLQTGRQSTIQAVQHPDLKATLAIPTLASPRVTARSSQVARSGSSCCMLLTAHRRSPPLVP